VAPNTVRYHLDRLAAPEPRPAPANAVPDARIPVDTRRRVAELLASGLSRAEVARRLGLSKPTVSYHARRLGHPVDERCARRYDWDAVQRFYDEGQSVDACVAAFGFSRQTWHAAVRAGRIVPRPVRLAIEDLCVEGVERSRGHLKRRLFEEGLKQRRCECCGLERWRGMPMPLALHHVNGARDDNRLENLAILCHNCHALTDTFAGRGGRGRGAPA
jgi:DNA-binding transcriptional ArsR family regulator